MKPGLGAELEITGHFLAKLVEKLVGQRNVVGCSPVGSHRVGLLSD